MRIALFLLVIVLALPSCRTVTEAEMAQRISDIDDALARPPTTGLPRRPSRAEPPSYDPAQTDTAPPRQAESSKTGSKTQSVAKATVAPRARVTPEKRPVPPGFAILDFDVDDEAHSIIVPKGYCNLFRINRPLPARLVRRLTGNSGGRFYPDMIAMPCTDIYTAGAQGLPTSFIFFVRTAVDGIPVDYSAESRDKGALPDRFGALIAASQQDIGAQWQAVSDFMRTVSFPPDIVKADVRFDGSVLSFEGVSDFQANGARHQFRLDATTFRFGDFYATIGVTQEAGAGEGSTVIGAVPVTADQVRHSLKLRR